MRWAALVTLAAGVVTALSAAQLAPGQAIDRVRVERSAALPDNLYLILGSPNEYARVAPGSWIGPLYWPPENPEARNNATMTWEIGYDDRPFSTERIVLANLSRDWSEDQRAAVSVEHVVGSRVVGTIPGFFLLQVERRSAPTELVVAFPIAPRLHAWVRFLSPRPENDSYYVKGSILASSWNRGQALLAMSRVKFEGNLPPALVTLRTRRKRVVGGFVVDFHRHAVIGIPAVLERRSGGGWRRISSVKTSRLGGYSFRVKPGSYRVRATLAGRFSAMSRALRVRR